MSSTLGLAALIVAAATARADVTGSWRVGFSYAQGEPIVEYCRYDLVEEAGGEIQGYLGVCVLGTDGVLSGTVDGSGALALRIVAPDDIGCVRYAIAGTVAPAADAFEGGWACDYPMTISGYLTATRCDPLVPGDCPETPGASLPLRTHEIRACTLTPATPCEGSIAARAKLKIQRSDPFHYTLNFKLPDAAGVTMADLGDPLTVRDYVACVYHTVGGSPVLAAMEPAWAATTCRDDPCWQVKPTTVKYRNRDAERGELAQLKVKVRSSGTANVTMKGRATTVLAPPSGSPLELPLVVRLLADDTCFGATFTTATVNTSGVMTAKGGQ